MTILAPTEKVRKKTRKPEIDLTRIKVRDKERRAQRDRHHSGHHSNKPALHLIF